MKKFFYLAMATALMVSCDNTTVDDLNGTNETNKLKAQYSKVFTDEFGKIDSKHTWGFSVLDNTNTLEFATKAANPNSNMYANFVVVPADITTKEVEKVVDAFKNATGVSSENVNWSDFFVQQVYKGVDVYKAKNNQDVNGSDLMNHLYAGNDHIFNFNDGLGQMILMQSSSTESFSYDNSCDAQRHYEYLILEVDGSYYVGFDFCANGQNPNQQVESDGVYTDWIVKISPAQYKNPTSSCRIMCEDLGTIGDFDFNDCVVDVAIIDNEAVVTLQAAGGTMPIFIGDNKHEVHELFGVDVKTMVNTGSVKKAPVIFRIAKPESNNAKDLNIIINNTKVNISYEIVAPTGSAPQKIAVPVTVNWTSERENIKAKYPKFVDYVSDQNVKFWE